MKDITGTRELSYAELEQRIEDIEDCMTANDKEMQKVYEENHALKRKLEDQMYLRKRHIDKDYNAIYSPEYYLRQYAKHTREDLILEIMELRITLRGMQHD